MSTLYDKKTFISSLAPKLYCADNLQFGLKIRQKKLALLCRYIQANDNYIKFLVIDCDHYNSLIWDEGRLAAPNFVIKNPENGHFHLVWALASPIYKDYVNKAKNLAYFAKIQQAYTEVCKGDKQYINLIVKNPYHNHWKTYQPNFDYAYTLDELADYVELPKTITKKQAIAEGRNCWLFDTVRKWAYKEVLFYKQNHATESDFYNVVLNKLDKLNIFDNAPALLFNEIKTIAKSISKWTWQHFSAEKFSDIQTKRSNQRSSVKKSKIAQMEIINEFS